MKQLQNKAIELLKRAEARGDIELNVNPDTAEVSASNMYADYYISTTNGVYKLTYYRYKWDDEADQMESWPYEDGLNVSDSLLELVEFIIDDVRN